MKPTGDMQKDLDFILCGKCGQWTPLAVRLLCEWQGHNRAYEAALARLIDALTGIVGGFAARRKKITDEGTLGLVVEILEKLGIPGSVE